MSNFIELRDEKTNDLLLKIRAFGKNDKGFVRRMKKIQRIQKMDDQLDMLLAMAEFYLDFVVFPETREEAVQALEDLSVSEFNQIGQAFSGLEDDPNSQANAES